MQRIRQLKRRSLGIFVHKAFAYLKKTGLVFEVQSTLRALGFLMATFIYVIHTDIIEVKMCSVTFDPFTPRNVKRNREISGNKFLCAHTKH